MYDVSLYGHLTFDRIFDGFEKDNSVGSMGNVWYHLNNTNPNLKINLEPTDIGEALILVNKEKIERASVANLNMKSRTPSILKSKWNHILYLNELSDLSFIKNIKTGLVSADTCRGRVLEDLNTLTYIDFLFISDEDLFMDPVELSGYVKQSVILHYPGGSICYNKDGSTIETMVKVVDNINVLGCGDMLASFFINEYLECNNMKKSIDKSHKLVSNCLGDRNEKI